MFPSIEKSRADLVKLGWKLLTKVTMGGKVTYTYNHPTVEGNVTFTVPL